MDGVRDLGPKKPLGDLFNCGFRVPVNNASEVHDQTDKYLKDVPSCENDKVSHHSRTIVEYQPGRGEVRNLMPGLDNDLFASKQHARGISVKVIIPCQT
jgi:hypothetical protein